jgi:branched-chain amino acid transport system substrate-binding protein
VRSRHASHALLALLAALALVLAGCGRERAGGGGSQSAPGLSDTTVKLGMSLPLSGPVSDAGQAQLGGARAYYEAVNAAGGVKMHDGKTRKIQLVYYDDAYEPARSVQNFRKLVDQDRVMAYVGSLGTAQNAGVMPIANQQGVPQVYVASGASLFSANPQKNKWTIGWQPTYETEGETLAKAVVALNKPIKVAVIRQNDDLGKAFLNGFNKGIQGSQVSVVANQTYEPTDTTLDSQVTNAAASHADALLSAVAVIRLQASALTKVRQVGWKPLVLLPGFTSGISTVLKPSGADRYFDRLYTTGFVKLPSDPQWSSDPAVMRYVQRMRQYSPQANVNIPNAAWGYATAATMVKTLESMTDLTRQGLMDAVHNLKASDIPMLLPGVALDGTIQGSSPLTATRLLKFSGGNWSLAATG